MKFTPPTGKHVLRYTLWTDDFWYKVWHFNREPAAGGGYDVYTFEIGNEPRAIPVAAVRHIEVEQIWEPYA